jgi:hypothetical protein
MIYQRDEERYFGKCQIAPKIFFVAERFFLRKILFRGLLFLCLGTLTLFGMSSSTRMMKRNKSTTGEWVRRRSPHLLWLPSSWYFGYVFGSVPRMTTVVEMRWLRSDSIRRDQKKESFNKSIFFFFTTTDSLIKEILVFERQWRHWREGNCWDCNLLDNRCVAASGYNANGLLTLMTPVVDEATVNSIWSKQRLFLIVGAWLPWC